MVTQESCQSTWKRLLVDTGRSRALRWGLRHYVDGVLKIVDEFEAIRWVPGVRRFIWLTRAVINENKPGFRDCRFWNAVRASFFGRVARERAFYSPRCGVDSFGGIRRFTLLPEFTHDRFCQACFLLLWL